MTKPGSQRVFVGRLKFNFKAVGSGPVASLRSRAFWRASFAMWWICLGVGGVSVLAAAVGCLTPRHGRTVFLSELSSIAPALSNAFVGNQTWRARWSQSVGLIGMRMQEAPDDAWIATSSLSMLLATRFPTSAIDPAPGIEVETPLPLPRPNGAARQSEGRVPPAVIEPQVASLAPQSQSTAGELSILDKLFADRDRAAKAVLAANPNTALYDITKRVVYLPDGDKLEAHSGYGQWMDNPDSFHRKNVGVTPPNIYSVSLREKPFHGVRALRLRPVGTGNMYGRDGFLSHSYLLGDGGASNGCISVQDYDRFLKAYEDGKFNQIIVLRNAHEAVAPQVASAQAEGT